MEGFYKDSSFRLDPLTDMIVIVFRIGRFLKSFPRKLLSQMNRNLVGSIYEKSAMKIAHFVSIHW